MATIDDILEAAEMMNNQPVPKPEPFGLTSHMMMGYRVVENPYMPDKVPVIELSKSVTVSDEVREQFDKWALDLFGSTTNVLMTDECIFMSAGTIRAFRESEYMRNGHTNMDAI